MLGRSATDTGLLLTAWPLALAGIAPIAGRLADRHHAGVLGAIGLSSMTLGLVLTALLPPEPSALAAWRPYMVLNFHGGTRSMWMTLASRAKIRAGFGHHAYSFIYNARIPRAQEILGEERPVHTAEHLASAMFWLGVPHTHIPRAKLIAQPLAQPHLCIIKKTKTKNITT